MILSTSKIIQTIFHNLESNEEVIIEDIRGKSISGSLFREDIMNFAKNLRASGEDDHSRIVVLIKDSIRFSQIVLSGMLIDATIVLLDPGIGSRMMREKIVSSKTTTLFIEGLFYDYLWISGSPILKMNLHIIIHGYTIFGNRHKKVQHFLGKNNADFEFVRASEDKESILVFTGGTTGDPQTVAHSLHSLHHTLLRIQDFCKDTQVFYADMPHFILLGLLSGAKVITGPYDLHPKKLMKVFEKYKVDMYFSPPYKYNYFIENNIILPITLKNILLGSAPIYRGFLKKLVRLADENQKIMCIYGMTEILPIAFIDGREKGEMTESGDVLGECVPGIEYKIVDDELLVSAEHQCKSSLGCVGEKYIATGDLVKIVDGKLVMMGRKKDMIIRKEYNIYPSLYEPIISQIPGVSSCALIGIYDEVLHDEKIVLYIESESSSPRLHTKMILDLLKSGDYSIDTFAIPDEIILMKLPRIGRQNKIDKNTLRKIAFSQL